jgi:hypothetical protein
VKALIGLGVSFDGCLMVAGLLSSCTLVLLPFGVHLIWIGFIGMVLFWIARRLV